MPQALVFALGAIGAAIMAKLIMKEWHRVNEELERSRAKPADVERAGAPILRPDPKTGVYHPNR